MADATYQPKVYNKQGGDEKVIASGGKITIESGGKLDLQNGAEFQFYDTDFTATKLENLMLSLTTYTIIDSTAYSLGVTPILSVPYGTIILSFATGATTDKVYCKLPAPQSGRILRFNASNVGANAVMVLSDNSAAVAAAAGQTAYLTDALSTALSALHISIGGQVELRYVDDTTWAVVTTNATVSEEAP